MSLTPHQFPMRCLPLLVLGLHTALVSAQSNDAQELVVQSGRLAQRQFDAPASIYAIEAEAIRGSGAQVNLSDVLNQAPGVVALNRHNYAQDVQISVRGFGARSAFGLRGFRLITDGIPATTPDGQGQASTVSLTSAERIEVLTGPLAQLYGNAAGGVIQVFSKEPSQTPTAQVQALTGSDGLSRSDWQFSQKSGNIGFLADYSTFHIQGYRAHSEAKREQLNALIRVDVSPQTNVKVIANSFNMPFAKDPLGLTLAQLTLNPKQAGNNAIANDTRKTVSQEQVGVVLAHQLNPETQVQARIYGGSRENLQYQASSPTAGSWVSLGRDFHGLGLQLKGRLSGLTPLPSDWIVGFDQDFSGEQRQGGLAANGIQKGALNRNEINESQNRDFFAQANWRISNQFTLTTGARRSNIQLESRDDYLSDGANGSGAVSYKAVNPVLGVTWHVHDTFNVYANAGKGFETPTLSESAYTRSGNTVLGLFNVGLVPSRSKHLETGFKWTPKTQTRISTALFQIKTDNEIVTSLSAGGRTAFVNSQNTLREGLEISARHFLNNHWRAQLTATAIQAEFGQNTSLAGKSLPGIPQQQLFSSVTWNEVGYLRSASSSMDGKEASLEWVARSKLWASDNNDISSAAPGYGVLNARFKQHFVAGHYRLEAFMGIDNLLDKKAVSSVIINQANKQFFEPALPRNWMLGVTAKLPL
ncbi:MAG: Fe(3+) dicitrate transport protein FecA precursor [Pseudomonadota bacterium]